MNIHSPNIHGANLDGKPGTRVRWTARLRDRWAGLLLRRLLAGIGAGRITIVLPSGTVIEQESGQPGADAHLVVHRWRMLHKVLVRGDVGFAEAYISEDWSSPDLTEAIAFAAQNSALLDRVVGGMRVMRLANRLRHALRRNNRAGSRRNIAFHYDLGNEFYRQWLDDDLIYSSALFSRPAQTLEDAQEAKLARVEHLLGAQPGLKALEIGCGWGALALRLARAGLDTRAITLSAEQCTLARARTRREGLSERLAIDIEDYRDTTGRFDRIVSIEMLEAVGERYWPAYFDALRARLAPGGRIVLQVITIAEDRYETYRASPDFIQRYIFPGGMLPTRSLLAEHAGRAGLALVHTETFAESYARTLAEWRRRFVVAWPDIERQGFAPSFRRLWAYYLSYCEAGFRTGAIDVGLYVLEGMPE